jgi:hypothetical protein
VGSKQDRSGVDEEFPGGSEAKPAMPLRLVDPSLNQTCGGELIK